MSYSAKPMQEKNRIYGRLSTNQQRWRIVRSLILLVAMAACWTQNAQAFRVSDVDQMEFSNVHILGHGRWDAAPHLVDGVERSLDSGLRYSIEGGSYQALLDQLQWRSAPPSVGDFQAAIDMAFDRWEAVDPESGLGTDLFFVPDLGTPAVLESFDGPTRVWKLNRGAEIDLFARPRFVDIGSLAGVSTFGDPDSNTVALTSGVENYPAPVISGADISMASDYAWPSLDFFHRILTHEIGHAIGLRDVNFHSERRGWSLFYDDNFDPTSDATALATLTNSFAHLIDPLDPDNSPGLNLYEPCDEPESLGETCTSRPGFDTPGVNLIETSPQFDPIFPQNDEFAGRQFLYPHLPGPGETLLLDGRMVAVMDDDFDDQGDIATDLSQSATSAIGEFDRSSVNRIDRLIAKFELPDAPAGSPELEKATLYFYVESYRGLPAGPLSLWHSAEDNDLDQLASDFEDSDYADTLLDLLDLADGPECGGGCDVGAYYHLDVTDLVLADYESDGATPLSAFRLQVNEAVYVEDGLMNQYVLQMPGSSFGHPKLHLTFVPEPSTFLAASLGFLGLLGCRRGRAAA